MHPFKIQGCLIFLCISVIFLTLDPGRSEASLLSGWILPDPSQVVMVGLFFLHVSDNSSKKVSYHSSDISN